MAGLASNGIHTVTWWLVGLENCPTLSACASLEEAGKVEFANGGPASSGPLLTVAGLNLTVGQWTQLANEQLEGVQYVLC